MTLKRRQFTREFKLQVLQEADTGTSISQLAREHQVHPTLIHRWRQQLRLQGDRAVVKRLCRTCSISRSSYYRGRRGTRDPDLELRDRIHKLSFSWPPTVTVP